MGGCAEFRDQDHEVARVADARPPVTAGRLCGSVGHRHGLEPEADPAVGDNEFAGCLQFVGAAPQNAERARYPIDHYARGYEEGTGRGK